MSTERIVLDPKASFLADRAKARVHSDLMASPSFQSATASALLAYQFRLGGAEPQALAIAMSKLRGAQEFVRVLMNLGLPEAPEKSPPDTGVLEPPETSLDRPYSPPPR